jgi:hypothetical protein
MAHFLGIMARKPKPHPSNVPGDFYVVDQCCTACGVPTNIAPDLFAFDEDHCFVKRQPSTKDEFERALKVVARQELGCIRYGGRDPVILRRLAEAGEGAQCDFARWTRVRPVLRNHVSVSARAAGTRSWDSAAVLEHFRSWIGARKPDYRTTDVRETGTCAVFSFTWYEDNFHEVVAEPRGDTVGQWLIHHSGNLAVSETLDEWLRSTDVFAEGRWYTEREWRRGASGQDRPW